MTDMTDAELIGYCDIHAETERALFSGAHINRMFKLAGIFEEERYCCNEKFFYPMKGEMKQLVSLARARMRKPKLRLHFYRNNIGIGNVILETWGIEFKNPQCLWLTAGEALQINGLKSSSDALSAAYAAWFPRA
jgi:hypothetical protein